ncbi:MAG: hypothetical protein ACPL7D_08680 [Candidatus Sumerlaeaceae bacterium]|jgi:hypothetical protein
MKEMIKKVLNKCGAPLFVVAAMVVMASTPTPAAARSSWYVSFSTGPVWVAPAPVYYPAPVVPCRPVYYHEECYPCPPAGVYYPGPIISVGYYSGRPYHHHWYRR